MPLIKSTHLIQTGTSTVAGDQIVSDSPVELAQVVPVGAQPSVEPTYSEPDYGEVPASEPEPTYGAIAPNEPEPPMEPEVQPASEAIGPAAYFEAFESERDELFQVAEGEAESAMREATGHLGAPDASLELAEAASTVAAAYAPGSPPYQAAMREITPFIESQAATALEAVSIQAAHDARWRTLGEAEEQLASLVDNFARRVMLDPPSEMVLHSLLSERESIMAEARLQAARIVAAAEESAAHALHQAQAQASHTILEVESKREAVLAQLKQQGYAEGYQEGRAQADEEGARIVGQATDALNHIAGLARTAAGRNEEKLLKLAIGIAERILLEEIEVRPDQVMRILDEALAKVSDLEEVIIKVNPEDLEVVQAREESIRDRLRNVRKVEIQANPKIQKGGVLIETGSGTVDAQIRTQLSVISEAFEAVRAEYAQVPVNMTGST